MGLGSKFFLIQLSMLLIFQCTNIILTKNLGPDSATIFNVAYKYTGIVYMCSIMILTPFWSAFTDAYEKKDYKWMTATYRKLNKIWLLSIPSVILLVIISKYAFAIWLRNDIVVPMRITALMGIYSVLMTRGALFMYLINGIGKVTLQMIVYVAFAMFSIPVMYVTSKYFGLEAIIVFCSIVYLAQAVIGQVQLGKILKKQDNGIWGK